MTVLQFLRSRDPGWAALRQGGRAAVVVPGIFALSDQVIGNPTISLNAAFGAIALLLFVDFRGPMRERLVALGWMVVAGAVLVCLATLISQALWLAVAGTFVITFVLLFCGILSSLVAASSTALLITFVVPVTLAPPLARTGDEVAGWVLAGAACLIGVRLLWPLPAREPLLVATSRACGRLGLRLRAEAAGPDGARGDGEPDRARLAADAAGAVVALQSSYFGAPFLPTGLTASSRALVRSVDELVWLSELLRRMPEGTAGAGDPRVREVRLASADLLVRGAERLEADRPDPAGFRLDLGRLTAAQAGLEEAVVSALSAGPAPASTELRGPDADAPGRPDRPRDLAAFIGSLEPSFRAQELSRVVAEIARHVAFAVAARSRPWWQRAAGRAPGGMPTPLSSVRARLRAQADPHSVWLQNSVRSALSLALAVLVAALSDVQHSFWVAFGTLGVLRSNAAMTGQSAVRAIVGNVIGIVVGGAVVYGAGSDTTVLWWLLPVAVLFAGFGPVFSSEAGQAGFTATLLILFDIIGPAGWSLGLIRVEDIAIGAGVSVAVGLLFWPRGAGAELRRSLAGDFEASARFLGAAVGYAVAACDPSRSAPGEPHAERFAAEAAARRVDSAFRGFVAEQGAKRLPLSDTTAMMTGALVLRSSAYSIVGLWARDRRPALAAPLPAAARDEVRQIGERLTGWYAGAARALAGDGAVPQPLPHDSGAGDRLLEAVRPDLTGGREEYRRAAIGLVWTADHLDVARRFQPVVAQPARDAAAPRGAARRKPSFRRT